MYKFLIVITGILIVLTCIAATSDMQTKTWQLHYHSADQVIVLLKPFLDDGGKIAGEGKMLVVETSAKNIEQLQQIITGIEIPPVLFQISVHSGGSQPDLENKDVVTYATDKQGAHPPLQRICVEEGQAAFINTGGTIPTLQQVSFNGNATTYNMSYQDVQTGFRVVPSKMGDSVQLKIVQQRQRESPRGADTVDSQALSTTVTIPLNKWVELGGTPSHDVNSADTIVYSTKPDNISGSVYVKVKLEDEQTGCQ